MLGLIIIGVIAIYLYVAYRVTLYIAKKSPREKYWIISILFFILLPTWDVILGKVYFNYLCRTEGGLRVYKKVKADGFMTEDSIATGDISYYKKQNFKYIEGIKFGKIQHLDLADTNQTIRILKEPQSKYMFIYNERSKPIIWLPITKNRALVKNRITNEVLGEVIKFKYFGSWIGIIADHLVSGISNPVDECSQNKDELLEQTLIQDTTKE